MNGASGSSDTVNQTPEEKTIMCTKQNALIAATLAAVILLSPGFSQAQEDDADLPPLKLKIQWPIKGGDGGMTAVDLPANGDEPRRTSLGWGKTANGYPIECFSDGSSVELRPECKIETTCNGTKIETLPSATTIVRWPNGGGVVRNPDGSGAEFRPDPKQPNKSGDLMPIQGTVEVLPTGTVRQTIKDEGVILDRQPNGTTRSRPDLVKRETTMTDQPVNKTVNVRLLSSGKAVRR